MRTVVPCRVAHGGWRSNLALGIFNGGNHMVEFDLEFLSLTLGLVGLFFICCAVLQKKPKQILEEAFGVAGGALRDLRASVFKRNQLVLGFVAIFTATVLRIFSHALAARDGGILDQFNAVTLALALGALVAALCGILNYLSRLFSKWHFKQIVTEVVTERRLPFETNVPLAIEIGQLLGLGRGEDDSVESYLRKLRVFLNLPPEPEPKRPTTRSSKIGIEFR